MIQRYCRSLHTVALARAAYHSGDASYDGRAADLALELHPHAVVNAAYHLEWPGKYVDRLDHLAEDSMQVDYSRIEERAKANKLLSFYRRQVKNCVEHALPNGVWLDGLSNDAGEDRARSIDVILTTADNVPLTSEDEQELTVEILLIEVRKPRE